METRIRTIQGFHSFRLKPSYEGWKLRRGDAPPGPGPRLKPSYEGWKLGRRAAPPGHPSRLKPSYEGWKRDGEPPGAHHRAVSSLPMRDGNLVLRRRVHRGGGVSSLPMRDGNGAGRGGQPPLDLVSSLPMRDGNEMTPSTVVTPGTCLKPSYEGWKPAFPSRTWPPVAGSQAFL